MERIVDARGMACPRPVVMTKKALDEEKGVMYITTIVDNPTAVENVCKLARSQGCEFRVEERGGEYVIKIGRPAGADPAESAHTGEMFDFPQEEIAGIPRRAAFMVTGDLFGRGDEELGRVLMKSFFYTLTQTDTRLKSLIFINRGVLLTTEGSGVAEYISELEQSGVEVVSCGTCLDFYRLKDKLLVGRVSNMYDIVEMLAAAGKVITV